MLSWQEIQALDDSVTEVVEAFGGEVKLVSLGAEEFADFLRRVGTNRELRSYTLLAMSIMNSDGTRVPKDSLQSFITALQKKQIDTVTKLIDAATRVNGLRKTDETERKNESGATVSGGSPIDSAQSSELQTSGVS